MTNLRPQTPAFTVSCNCGDTFTATADELVEIADTHICPLAPAGNIYEDATVAGEPDYEDFIAEEVAAMERELAERLPGADPHRIIEATGSVAPVAPGLPLYVTDDYFVCRSLHGGTVSLFRDGSFTYWIPEEAREALA